MPGAKWTQKDYQATAELIGKIALHQGNLWALTSIATWHCWENAKRDINGNRNFKPERFIKECYKQAGSGINDITVQSLLRECHLG